MQPPTENLPSAVGVLEQSEDVAGGLHQRMVRVRTVDELTRLAFLWAEQDREALADAWPPKSEERADAENDAKELRQYRLKRWGKTKIEAFMDAPGKSVNPLTLKHSNEKGQR